MAPSHIRALDRRASLRRSADASGHEYIDPDTNCNSGGYVDDVQGWDFVNNDATVYDPGSADETDGHGTHVTVQKDVLTSTRTHRVATRAGTKVRENGRLADLSGFAEATVHADEYLEVPDRRAARPVGQMRHRGRELSGSGSS